MATGKLPLSDLVGLLSRCGREQCGGRQNAISYLSWRTTNLYASEKRIPGNMAKLDTVTLRRTVNVLDDYRKSVERQRHLWSAL